MSMEAAGWTALVCVGVIVLHASLKKRGIVDLEAIAP